MAIIHLKVDVSKAVGKLEQVQARLSNLIPALTAIKEVALDSIRQTFAAGGRPTPWAPLKSRQGIPLNGRGILRGSITGEVRSTSVILGTNVVYAAIHQFGGTVQIPALQPKRPGGTLRWYDQGGNPVFRKRTSAHSVTIPQRSYLLVQDGDIETFKAILLAHITGA